MKIGYCFTGSFCTLARAYSAMEELLVAGHTVVPIMSENAYYTDTRFGSAEEFSRRVEAVCGRPVIHTVKDAEPLGPAEPLELLVIAPCTGNTLSKLASGITDTAATMAAKAHLRCDRPLLIALSTNDAMSRNLSNIAALLCRKAVYFLPMRQDDPKNKPYSLVAKYELMNEAVGAAMRGEQMRPIFL